MLSLSQAEAIRIAIVALEEKAHPTENISVGIGRVLINGQVPMVITRTSKAD